MNKEYILSQALAMKREYSTPTTSPDSNKLKPYTILNLRTSSRIESTGNFSYYVQIDRRCHTLHHRELLQTGRSSYWQQHGIPL